MRKSKTWSGRVESARAPLEPDEVRDGTAAGLGTAGRKGRKGGARPHCRSRPVICGPGLDSKYSNERPSGSAALPVSALAAEPAGACVPEHGRRIHGVRQTLLPVHTPATLADFQWFSGLRRQNRKGCDRAARAGIPFASDARLMFPEDRDLFESFTVPAEPHTLSSAVSTP
jgi:hypothetical protein